MTQKREKFRELAEGRTTKALDAIARIGNLSNRQVYEYEDVEVKKIMRALRDAVAEVEARFRLAVGRHTQVDEIDGGGAITAGALTIDEGTYTVRLRGKALDLTYKEFELLKYLAQHPGRVFTRAQLLQEVWGYDYFGGTRTVDVHVRRLRAKLGTEHETLIGTVRNVGYRFVPEDEEAEVGAS